MKLKFALLICVLSVLTIRLQAQPDGKVLTVFNQAYVPLSNATVISPALWDDFNAKIPLGFTYKLMGQTTDTLYFSASQLGGDLLVNLKDQTNLVGTFADFLESANNPIGSTVSYSIDASGNKKIAKVQWQNAALYDDPNLTDSINLQIWIYEGTNDVEFRIGPNYVADLATDLLINPFFGLAKNIDTLNYTVDSIYFALTASPAVIGNMDSVQFDNAINANLSSIGLTTSAYPAAGTVFRYATPQINAVGNVELNAAISLSSLAHDQLLVQNKSNTAYQMNIYNMQGNLLYQQALTTNATVSTAEWPAAQYIVVFTTDQQKVAYKFNKQ